MLPPDVQAGARASQLTVAYALDDGIGTVRLTWPALVRSQNQITDSSNFRNLFQSALEVSKLLDATDVARRRLADVVARRTAYLVSRVSLIW